MKYLRYVLIALIISSLIPLNVYAESITTGTINAELGLRIRSGPGTNYEKIGLANYNSKVTILSYHNTGSGCTKEWIKIKSDSGITGYVCSDYVINIVTRELTAEEIAQQNQSTQNQGTVTETGARMAAMTAEEFEQYLTSQGFPESYKVKLRELHQKHPTWIFKGVKSNYNWTQALNEQDTTGTSLLNVNPTYASNGYEGYLSVAPADYDHNNNKFIPHDGKYWFQANRQTIAHYLDPRNFLTEKEIFMFEELFYYPSYQNEDMVKITLSSAFLKQFSSYFMEASIASQVSPIFLAALAKQEVGTSNTNICTNGNAGVLDDGVNYSGYYNFFNIGASSSNNPKLKSLQYAKKKGWDSPRKAIVEGSQIISNNYVNCGQYTSYFQKFNLAPTATKPMWHQYTTNVSALSSPAISTYNAYNSVGLIEKDFVFAIPIYDGMPESTPLPSLGNPNNWLKELKVNGSLVTNFDNDNLNYVINTAYTESVVVSATPIVGTASVTGVGTIALTGDSTVINVNVTAQNGSVRTYKITVNRQPKPVVPTVPDTPPTPPDDNNNNNNDGVTVNLNEVLNNTSFKYNDKYLWNITLGSTVGSLTEELTKKYNTITVNVFDRNNNPKSQGRLVSGDKVIISSNGTNKTLNIVIYGDVDGSGTISAVDLLHVQKHILGFTKLTDSLLMAADVNKDSKISAIDLLQIQKHLLNYANISQG